MDRCRRVRTNGAHKGEGPKARKQRELSTKEREALGHYNSVFRGRKPPPETDYGSWGDGRLRKRALSTAADPLELALRDSRLYLQMFLRGLLEGTYGGRGGIPKGLKQSRERDGHGKEDG